MADQGDGEGSMNVPVSSDLFAPPLFTFSGLDNADDADLDPVDDFFMQEFFAQTSESAQHAIDDVFSPGADLAPFGAGASQEFSSGAADFASSDSPRRARQSSSSLAESSSQARQVQVPVSLRTSSSVLDQQRLAAEIEEKVNEAMRETDSRKRKNDSPDGGDAQRQRVEDDENEDGMDRLEK
ncbi:unnamed protein product, partial [Symbiodinium sp. KB8]